MGVSNFILSSLIAHPMFINWNPSEVIGHLGPITLRWYGMCWLVGIVGAYFMVKWLYKDQKIKDELFDPLFIYSFIGILVGARLGHCLFYEPDYFLSSGTHFIEMFVPMHKMADGTWKFTGYAGLASHGGTLGLMIALWLYCRKTKMNLWHVLDDIAIATPITACCIRLGNLMNSEIIGKPTDVPWAFIFEQVDNVPRHPGQLYEAIAYFCFIFVMLGFYFKSRGRRNEEPSSLIFHHSSKPVGTGFYFGLVLTLIFTFRFFIEYTKADQVDFEAGMPFNMGQLLSVPFIIIGVATMIGGKWMQKLGAK
ncbi:MAG: prolipoprotein diacylglyceryl transferase [Prevotella sp.]|nr:prolipoprotein diacylglyceryl transferase [Prevotella sp.]